ncbi:hypothetical protein [Arthrobacter rhombi]|uniref:hypothetical protein n=1 Tax=Arthrobacter rhombi TaxID=71253 RepID=UPI003FD4E231
MSEDAMEPAEDEAAEFDELLTRIPEMDRRLANTEEAVEGLLAVLANYPAGGPWLWDGLEPDAKRDLWIELDAFVVWLQNRILCHHADRTRWITPCWYLHPDVVEQLTALMVAHKASYHPKAKTPSHMLVDWFQRCLWPTMDSLKDRLTLKPCQTQREHVEAYMKGTNLAGGSEDFLAFVEETVPGSVEEEPEAPAADRETGEVIEPPNDEAPADHGEEGQGHRG